MYDGYFKIKENELNEHAYPKSNLKINVVCCVGRVEIQIEI